MRGKQVGAAGEGAVDMDALAGDRLGDAAAAASSETSPFSSRTTTTSLTPALVSASTSAGPIVVPFLSTSDPWRRVWTVTPPIASVGTGRAELHAACSSFLGGKRSCAVISAMIETAISAGDTAPIGKPIGAWMRATSASRGALRLQPLARACHGSFASRARRYRSSPSRRRAAAPDRRSSDHASAPRTRCSDRC